MLKAQIYLALTCILANFVAPTWEAVEKKSTGSHVRRQDAADGSGEKITIDFMLSNWWNNTQYLAMSNPNVDFVKDGAYNDSTVEATSTTPLIIGIEVQERREYQRMSGLGASMTDASAIVLQSLRVDHPDAYDEILHLAFSESDEWMAKGGAGMNMIRMPIGSCDFGFEQYSYDDPVDGTPDPDLKLFDIAKSPKRWQTLRDIIAINKNVKFIGAAWSPPAWMKDSGKYAGGDILQKYESVYCDYLVKFVQTAGSEENVHLEYISMINNPLQTLDVRPSTHMSPEQQARIGLMCRNKFDAAGLQNVKFLAYDYDWDHPDYAIKVFDKAKEAFDGVGWHCHGGDPSQQDDFNKKYPDQEVFLTECTRITQYDKETWSNLKDQFKELIIGSIDYGSQAIVLWNLALQVDEDGFTTPVLPDQCRNCLAPFLIFNNATQPNLEGSNMTQINAAKHDPSFAPTTSKRDLKDTTLNELPLNQENEIHAASFMEQSIKGMIRRQEKDAQSGSLTNAKNVPTDQVNKGADNEGKVIPPYRDTYYQTSDFVAMVHLGRAIRPNQKGGRWAQRIDVTTTDDEKERARVKAQLFRNSLGNGRSRWSLLLLQRNDHYRYYLAEREDITLQIKFRDSVATLILPPGVFTISWEAQDSKYEHDDD